MNCTFCPSLNPIEISTKMMKMRGTKKDVKRRNPELMVEGTKGYEMLSSLKQNKIL